VVAVNLCFNPVLGFLSVSTVRVLSASFVAAQFQSRAGFSECLDLDLDHYRGTSYSSFNPVLGFLSVSTDGLVGYICYGHRFQSRAGFSECLDDNLPVRSVPARRGFNPVLGFLSVSTTSSDRATFRIVS